MQSANAWDVSHKQVGLSFPGEGFGVCCCGEKIMEESYVFNPQQWVCPHCGNGY